MYSLKLLNLNISAIKKFVCLVLCLSLFACSSVKQVNKSDYYDHNNAQSFINGKFSRSEFTPTNKHTIKKTLQSDHHLMMSLLNRPMTADQAMMLAFAQEREKYSLPYSTYAVEIKGAKNTNETKHRSYNAYASLISEDINAVSLSAPK